MPNKMSLHELFAFAEETPKAACSQEALNRIKANVNAQILSKPKHNKIIRIVIIAAAITLTAAVTVAAAGQWLGLRPFTKQEKQSIKQPAYAVFSQDAPEASEPHIFGETAQIIDEEYLDGTRSFLFTSIDTWATEETGAQYSIPEFVFENGDIAIFTKSDTQGWGLQKGDTLTLSFAQNVKENPRADAIGDNISIGIIKNGVPHTLTTEKNLTIQYEYTADKDSTYYFFVQNASAASVVIKQGTIAHNED